MPPITPEQIIAARLKDVPEAVINAWNSVIAKYFNGSARGGISRFVQSVLFEAIMKEMNCTLFEVSENHWLDLEPIYREAGWEVKYDRPGYNENYEAYFEFSFKQR